MFKFITHRHFLINFLIAIILAVLLILGTLKLLGKITKHDSYLKVPPVIGKNTNEAIKLLEKAGFEVTIQDSVFIDTITRGIVLKQLPDPNATVKINRTVFLTVNRFMPPLLDMPKLEGQSLSLAIGILERSHLKLGDTIFKPNFMIGTVLEQQYNGVPIPEKAKVPWGGKITLVIGSGLGERQISVPNLVGMTYRDAKAIIDADGLTLGAVIPNADVKDTVNAYVYKQNPERYDETQNPRYIQSGQLMDLWISKTNIIPVDSTLLSTDSVKQDELQPVEPKPKKKNIIKKDNHTNLKEGIKKIHKQIITSPNP